MDIIGHLHQTRKDGNKEDLDHELLSTILLGYISFTPGSQNWFIGLARELSLG